MLLPHLAGQTSDPRSAGPGCEVLHAGFLAEPVAAVTSFAIVVAGLVILVSERTLARRRRADGTPGTAPNQPSARGYATLVAAVGVGSFVQHGPNPPWADLAHDLPLLAVLAFVAADAAADLTGRARRWWWWAAPTLAAVPLIVLTPRPADLAQVGVAVVAVALMLRRARIRPTVRTRIAVAIALLAFGGVIGTLSRSGGPLCVPESLWQGHGLWHVLVAVALVVLAPVIDHRGR